MRSKTLSEYSVRADWKDGVKDEYMHFVRSSLLNYQCLVHMHAYSVKTQARVLHYSQEK